jgi:hypothetical protein
MAEAKRSGPDVAGTVVDWMEVVIAMMIVVGLREVQPGLQLGTSIIFRPQGMA